MKNKSYFTTPLFVITTLIGLFVLVQTHQTSAFLMNTYDSIERDTIYEGHLLKKKLIHYLEQQRLYEEQQLNKKNHKETPESVKAIYISSWVFGTSSMRNELIEFIESSDINAVVVDIKDSTGVISFAVDHPLLNTYGTDSHRIRNISELIQELHEKDIYVIGRLTIFQDPALTKKHPHLSFKRIDNGEVWTDRKGLAFTNPKMKEVWEYTAVLAEYSYALGFDEINFDYIRYPSDGVISNIDYGLIGEESRSSVLKEFYIYLDERLRSQNIPISVDIFGLVTTAQDDLGIGQIFEDLYPHFDAIAPMVYPSHYSTGFFGFTHPNSRPYEVVSLAMDAAKNRAIEMNEDPLKLRTWIQDFSLDGVVYGTKEVQAQIRATYDIGLNSFMAWDPRNRYTREAYNALQ